MKFPSIIFGRNFGKMIKKIDIGDGIFFKDKLVGYHSYFEKKLVYNKKSL